MVGWWIIAWFSWFDIAKRWTTKDSSLLKLCYFRWTILCYYYSTISNTKRWIGYFIKENIDMTTNWNIQSLVLLSFVSINNIKLGHVSVSIIVYFFLHNKVIFKGYLKVHILAGPPRPPPKKTYHGISHFGGFGVANHIQNHCHICRTKWKGKCKHISNTCFHWELTLFPFRHKKLQLTWNYS